MHPHKACARLPLIAFLMLGTALVQTSSGCTLDQAGTAPAETSSGGSGTGGGNATAASGSSSVTSGSGTSSTGMVGTEDCLDGMDNDNNGQTDCADAACQPGFECVDTIPAGWTDYVRVHTVPYGTATNATCPGGGSPTRNVAGPAGAPQCTQCQCNLQGASCSMPPISCHVGSSNCMGTANFTAQAMSAACFNGMMIPTGNTTTASCRLGGMAMVMNPGTCTLSGGMEMSTPPFADDVLLCELSAGIAAGCGAGQACVPRGSGDFSGDICIARTGTGPCPTGWNGIQTFGDEGSDDRTCSACSCNPVCNGASYTVHDNPNCAVATSDRNVSSGTCVDVGANFDNNTASFTPTLAQPAAGCSGGVPAGQVSPAEPYFICCPP